MEILVIQKKDVSVSKSQAHKANRCAMMIEWLTSGKMYKKSDTVVWQERNRKKFQSVCTDDRVENIGRT